MSDRETVLAGVREALAGVANPRTGEDVLAGGQVQGLSLDEDGKVHFQFLLKAEDPGTLVRAARAAAESVAGVSKVKIEVKLPNNHWQYALTWFGLALALSGVYGVWLAGRLRRR